MKVALITCGWSALEGWLGADWSRYDEVVGVNWAGHYFETTWVATWDAVCWRHGKMMMPSVGIVTMGSPSFLNGKRFEHLEMEDFCLTHPEWNKTLCNTTFPNALAWALDKWPEAEIDIYGLDMTHDAGLSPFDVGSAIRSRSGERWRHECLYLRQLFEPNMDRLRLVGCLCDPSWFS